MKTGSTTRAKAPFIIVPLVCAAAVILSPCPSCAADGGRRVTELPPGPAWKILSMFSGKDNYYSHVEQDGVRFIKARYEPRFKAAVLYHELDHNAVYKSLSWRWRGHTFPKQSPADKGELDCPAGVYVLFKSGLFYRVLKYVWSVNQPPGSNYRHPKSTFFAKMQVVVDG